MLFACDPPSSVERGYQLDVRAPERGTLVIEDQAVSLLAETRVQLGGLGPPPWTATFITADASSPSSTSRPMASIWCACPAPRMADRAT